MKTSENRTVIGILGAMEPEVEILTGALDDPRKETVGGVTYHCGRLGSTPVVVARCGVGKVCAAACTQVMILRYGVGLLINTGVGGGIDPALSIGDVAIATALVQHDVDTTAVGDPPALISALGLVEMEADADLSDRAAALCHRAGIRYVRGVIATGDQFICTKAQKDSLRDRFHAVACEMEGGAVAQICAMNDVRFCVLRAISDNADEQATTDYPAFVRAMAAKMASVVLALIREQSEL